MSTLQTGARDKRQSAMAVVAPRSPRDDGPTKTRTIYKMRSVHRNGCLSPDATAVVQTPALVQIRLGSRNSERQDSSRKVHTKCCQAFRGCKTQANALLPLLLNDAMRLLQIRRPPKNAGGGGDQITPKANLSCIPDRRRTDSAGRKANRGMRYERAVDPAFYS